MGCSGPTRPRIDFNRLSRIGFGGHRITTRSSEHREALTRALQLGCNVLDTSADYMQGESELLIGQVLAENPKIAAFIITKSGYEIEDRSDPDCDGRATGHFLHPDSLRARITRSLERLGSGHIDGYLLHNPEAQLEWPENAPSLDEFYARIEEAFAFLEECVERGTIRYYGISSNTFHLPTSNANTINLHRVLKLAHAISKKAHFKLIEFPFNLVETGAIQPHHDGVSLMQVARSNGLITFANRPLNAYTSAGALRLALYPEDTMAPINESQDRAVVETWLEQVSCQLRAIGEPDDPLAFGVVQHLNRHWMDIGNPEAVEQIFNQYLYPFLMRLYRDEIPEPDRQVCQSLYEVAIRHARLTRSRLTQEFRAALVQRGELAADDRRPLPVVACERYLSAGIDCVLVGMSKVQYVEDLKPLLA